MRKEKGILSKAMQQHNIVFLLVFMLVVAGIYGLVKMNKDEYPQFTIRQGVVVGVYPGATSVEIAEQLTKPLENHLYTYPEVDKQLTYSYSQDGMAYVFVELNMNVHNKNEAWSKIRHGLKDFKMMLPAGVLALVVMDDFGNTSSMLITLESADKSQRELQTYMGTLCDRLRTIPAMGNLRILGAQNEEISISIEPEKLAMYGISSQTLMANLYTQGFLTTGGNVSSGQFSQPIHIESPLQSEQEIAEQIIYTDPAGNTIRMRDVARIERRYSQPTDYINNNGNRALLLSLEMRPGNNIVAFGASVNEIVDEFQQELPPSVALSRISNQPKVVGDSVWSFLRDLVTSMAIVIAVMLLLFPLRSALVAGTSIPICTGISLAIMFVFKIELNTVTLAALITVLGMMVDNSIVMIDGYIERIERGTSRWHSAIASAKELFPPLLLATVAISGMFFPVKHVLTGPMKDFVTLFPWTIAISMLISLVYAALVVPYLEFSFIKPAKSDQKPNLVARIQNKFFYWLQGGYEWLLRLCFRHPYLTMLTAVGTTLVGVAMFLSLNVQMMPMAERPCFAVEISLPMGSTLDQTAAVSDSLQKILLADERITTVTAFVGNSSPRFQATYAPNIPGSHFAQFIVNTESNKATEEILNEYAHYANYFPNAYVRFKQIDYQAVANPVEVRFTGRNRDELQAQADKLMAYMRTLTDKVQWVHSDCDGTLPCINIELRADEATRLGITKGMLSMHLAAATGGQPLTTLWEDDYSVPVKLYTTPHADAETDYQELENLLVPTALGTWVPLRQVATLTPGWQPARIVHRNGVPCVTVGADLVRGVSQPVAMKDVMRFVEDEMIPNLPEGVEVSYGGLTASNQHLIPELVWGVALAVLVIFLFLIFNFGKINIAILTLGACMLCFFGAFFGLWMFGLDFSITAILGIVSLIGIIVRNGIIMFEHAEDLRLHQHKTAREAGFDAGKRRMRPIFLTSATTALGVVPMIASGTSLWMPMGVVICFGTIFSLVLIVTVLPVAYWLIYKRKDKNKPARKGMNILKHRKALAVAFVLLCAGGGRAYAEGLSLDSCLTLALQNNVQIKNAVLEKEAAEQVKKQAFTKYFPNISGIAAGFHAVDPLVELGINDIGNAGVRSLLNTLYAEYGAALGLPNSLQMFHHGIVGGVTAVQPVFAGGQIVNGNRLAKLGVAAAELQTEMTEQEVLRQTEESYWLVVSLHEKAKTIGQVTAMLDTIYRDATAARDAGLITQNDVLKVTLKQNEMASNLLKVENGIRLATLALCQSIGIEYSDTLQLADTLSGNLEEPLQYYKNADETVSERTEKKLLDLSVEAEILQRKMTVGSTLPTVAVGAGYIYNNLFERNDFNGIVFATMQVPITSWWETGHKLKQQKIKQQIAENNRDDLTEKLGLQAQQAWNELEEAYSQVALADTTLENARQNMDIAQQNFHAGLISMSELLEAQTLYRQAVDQQCDARIAYRIKLSRYKQYAGASQ